MRLRMGAQIVWLYMGVLSLTLAQQSSQIRTDSQTDRRIHNLEMELSKLRVLHHTGRDKLRDMERELSHYQTGLNLLCGAWKEHKAKFTPLPGVNQPIKSIRPTVSGIQVHSVSTIISPLGVDNTVLQISVRYSTVETTEVIWAYNVLGHMVPVLDGDPYSSVHNEQEVESWTTNLYIDARDLTEIELLYVKILSEYSEVTILFNKDLLLKEGKVNLSPVKLWNEGPSPEAVVFNPKHNSTITTYIDTNIHKLTTFVNFIGINSTEYPHKLLDLQTNDRMIKSVISDTTRGFKWSVNVDPSLVGIGGMLSLRVVEQLYNGPVLQIHVGKTVYIIPEKVGVAKAPFAPNSLALLSLYRHTNQVVATKPPIGAIWCYAFGNPPPETFIVRLMPGRKRQVMKGTVFNIGKYDTAQVVVLKNVTSNDNGHYMCEGRSGNNAATEPIIVQLKT
ncbi:uncharacterized protein LOC128239440 isoform X2 [Mya arenaria]|uniref:uncharacterized protein LOC128239440 isoform X2 n=1 Tax=Mya arenaria TaxID=6604 RepID=UPI0022E82A8F|nr:uncharacterized protein LOC128239440 isoform X2 [Mya arenaria]